MHASIIAHLAARLAHQNELRKNVMIENHLPTEANAACHPIGVGETQRCNLQA